ncbi:MAG: CocE/NonD family hydrolase [Chloroflexi bacterium]|nr:CocE/NonD family hydrolase [Chloroflexota bacterium]
MSDSTYTIRKDLEQRMRDGTILRGDLFLPDGDGPFPALVERTPYNKENSPEMQVGGPKFFAAHGYAVLVQDVRGRFKSGGKFIPFHDDGWGPNRDGYDTIEWMAAQPWCNGSVGMIGGSYAGATQYRAAPTRPPHLRALYSRESSANYRDEWVYHGGAFELGFMLSWTLARTKDGLAAGAPDEERAARRGQVEGALADIAQWYGHLPLYPNPLVAGLDDWYNDYLANPADGPFWWPWNIDQKFQEIETPIVHLGGWFDIFLAGTLKNYVGTRQKARTPAARAAQRLLVGPWIHGPWNMATGTQGEIDFGADSTRDYNAIRLPWFDHWLKGAPNGVPGEQPVQLFVMGENRWRGFDEYPVPGAHDAAWHLRDGGQLTPDAPSGAEHADGYVYDPLDPVPTRGGNTLGLPGGSFDQRPIESRCLVYTSEPLSADLTIIGDVKCILHGMSTAPDTDWVVRLTDVHPDGCSRLLCDGILRARFARSATEPQLLEPNQVHELTVDLWATANTFKAGHRIRVAVTSSSFPRFDRNLNDGALNNAASATPQTAYNTVFHDAARPSRIMLPVVS